jgi:hypothetical protein
LLKDRAIALGGRRHGHIDDLAGGRIRQQMHLNPRPAALDTMLAGVPLAITRYLETRGIDQQAGVFAGPKGREAGRQLGLALAQKGMVGHLLWVETVGLEDGACRAFQYPVGQAQRHPHHQERFNEGIGVALRSATANLADRCFQHLGVEQESEGQGAAPFGLGGHCGCHP